MRRKNETKERWADNSTQDNGPSGASVLPWKHQKDAFTFELVSSDKPGQAN